MERFSRDLNQALEESDGARQSRRKLGLRRRTKSAGNLPACVATIVEDASSSSPSQPPIITQPLSDSDEQQHIKTVNMKSRNQHYITQVGNFESDSFNENFSPTRPPNCRRKRKYKKMAVDYTDGSNPNGSPIEVNEQDSSLTQSVGHHLSPVSLINKKKRIFKQDRPNCFSVKRKWSHRDKDVTEMRERSFSGGCTSKPYFFGKTSKKFGIEKLVKFKEKSTLHPSKLFPKTLETAKITPATLQSGTGLLQSPTFSFVYKHPSSISIINKAPPIFSSNMTKPLSGTQSKHRRKFRSKDKGKKNHSKKNEDGGDCSMVSSSSLSSSDSDGVVTNDSDREGDDELTDWPGSEEISLFNKTLNLKTPRSVTVPFKPQQKQLAKGKMLSKHSSKKFEKGKSLDLNEAPMIEDDTMMSDSAILDSNDYSVTKDALQSTSFKSFSDVKNAGLLDQNTNKAFFRSFQAFNEKTPQTNYNTSQTIGSNFSLQKTSSSDLNISERSPQSDTYTSEHSASNISEIREIRAGCRRLRDERPSLLILCMANEQLSKFLQDSYQSELELPLYQNDLEEREKLESLAKLYSLELKVEMGKLILRKTSNTTQAIKVEQNRIHNTNLLSDYKRRCYGDSTQLNSFTNDISLMSDEERTQLPSSEFTNSLIEKSLLDPGDID